MDPHIGYRKNRKTIFTTRDPHIGYLKHRKTIFTTRDPHIGYPAINDPSAVNNDTKP